MEEFSGGRGVVVLAVSSIILKLLSALYVPFLAQILTDEGVAIYSVGYDVLIFLFAITSISFQPVITRLVSEQIANDEKENAIKVTKISIRILLIYGCIITLIFLISAKPLSILLNSEKSMMVFIFLSPSIILSILLSVYRGFFQAYRDMITISISNIIEQFLNVVFSLLFAYLLINFSTSWGSVGGTIGTIVGAIGAIIYVRYIFKKRYKNIIYDRKDVMLKDKVIIKRLIKGAIPFILIAAIQNISGIIDIFTIRTFLDTDINTQTATLKYFLTILNVPLVIITSIGIGIFPRVINAYVKMNKQELVNQTSFCYKLVYIITIPSVCGLMILSKDIFKFLFNRDFGYEILLIGAILLIFIAIATIQNILLQGMNKFKFIIKLGLVSIVIKIFSNIIFIKIDRINVIGAVIGSVISFAITVIFNHINLQKYFKSKISILNQSKLPLMASIVMSVVLLLLRYQLFNDFIVENYTRVNIGVMTITLVVIGGVSYLLFLLLLGGINKYELDTISPKIYKFLPNKLKKKVLK